MEKLLLSKTIFSHVAILKIVHLVQEKYCINVTETGDNYILDITSLNEGPFDKISFLKMLNEQQLKETLNNQFGELRELIYKKAFSRFEEA